MILKVDENHWYDSSNGIQYQYQPQPDNSPLLRAYLGGSESMLLVGRPAEAFAVWLTAYQHLDVVVWADTHERLVLLDADARICGRQLYNEHGPDFEVGSWYDRAQAIIAVEAVGLPITAGHLDRWIGTARQAYLDMANGLDAASDT